MAENPNVSVTQMDTGIKPLKYIRRAVAESLYNDGYLATIPPDDLRKGAKR